MWQEIILATNPTIEGDATAFYIASMAKQYQISVTRIAHGVPVGGELELVDGMTFIAFIEWPPSAGIIFHAGKFSRLENLPFIPILFPVLRTSP